MLLSQNRKVNIVKQNKDVKILAVDDSNTNIVLLQGILHDEGYQIITATDGKEALRLIEKDPPDLVLLDLMMPKIDGFKFMEELQKKQQYKEIPVLVVSARTEDENIEKAKALGAAGFIKKPLKIQSFIDKIDFILEQTIE